MKRHDVQKLATLDVDTLQKQLVDITQQAAKARLEKKVGKLQNVRLASSLAKDIARIKTILGSKGVRV